MMRIIYAHKPTLSYAFHPFAQRFHLSTQISTSCNWAASESIKSFNPPQNQIFASRMRFYIYWSACRCDRTKSDTFHKDLCNFALFIFKLLFCVRVLRANACHRSTILNRWCLVVTSGCCRSVHCHYLKRLNSLIQHLTWPKPMFNSGSGEQHKQIYRT